MSLCIEASEFQKLYLLQEEVSKLLNVMIKRMEEGEK
jgi:hypothetical protein